MIDHVSRDCPQGASPLCFFATGGPQEGRLFDENREAVNAPSPTILRISGSFEGRARAQ